MELVVPWHPFMMSSSGSNYGHSYEPLSHSDSRNGSPTQDVMIQNQLIENNVALARVPT